MTRPRRLPPLLRLLFVFLPGSDAECVRGDLEERYRRLAAHNPQLALRTVLSDAMRSVLWWWSPTAVRRRQVQSPNTLDAQEGERVSISMLVSDLRFTLRSLSRRPGFAAVVILTLGFGIGATATLYTIVDAVIVRPLPYDGADRLVALGITFPGREWADQKADLQALAGVSQLNFADWRERTRSFDAMAAAEPTAALMPTAEGGSELVPMARVTEGFFDLLRVRPLLGRTFRPDDHIGQSGALVVLSYGEWKTRYGGDPRVVGARLETLGTPYTILGVLPPEFRTPEVMGVDVALWIPLNGSDRRYRERGNRSLYVFGRLAEGATLANARAEVDNVQTALAQEFPEGNVYPNGDHFGAGANFLQDETVGASGRTLIIFFGAAALLLLIASLNAANLLLARGLDRQGEMSIRRALGAGRRRLTHGILLESVVLSLGGGLLGVALAFGGVQAFLAVAPADFPRLAEVAVNYRIIGIAALASVATGILVGAVPALRLTGTDLATAIRERGGPTATHPGGRLRDVLVGGQLALAVVLGVGASLLFNSFVRVSMVDPGFEPAGLSAFSLALKRPGAPPDEATWQAWDGLLSEIRGVPGMRGVAAASNLPFQSPNWAPAVLLPEDPPDYQRTGIAGYVITPNFFSVAGIPVVAGRVFTSADRAGSSPVAVVNRALVREHLGGREPLGFTIRFRADGSYQTLEIVGVVGDVVQTRAEDGWQPAVYVPYTQADWPWVHVAVRSDRPLEGLFADLRRAAARFSPYVPLRNLNSFPARIRAVQTAPRFYALLIGSFAAIAVLLAAIGLYGSLAYSVSRRKPELGIRMALGADTAGIFRLVLQRGLAVTAIGLTIGIASAIALTRLLKSFLFGIGVLDPVSFGAAAVVLLLAALLATAVPARRATRVDVMGSLRAE